MGNTRTKLQRTVLCTLQNKTLPPRSRWLIFGQELKFPIGLLVGVRIVLSPRPVRVNVTWCSGHNGGNYHDVDFIYELF